MHLSLFLSAYFNPHSREGSDIDGLMVSMYNAQISIHTPARGVTSPAAHTTIVVTDFNPHSRTGSDLSVWHI